MKLINKGKYKLIENTDGLILVQGHFEYEEVEERYSLHGTIYLLNGDYLGNYSYNIYKGNIVDKNIGKLKFIYLSAVEQLLDNTVKYLINDL